MTRRLLAVLIILVGLAGVGVAGLSTLAPFEDRTSSTQPGPIRSVEVDVEAGRVEVVAGQADEATVERTRRYVRGTPLTSETLVDGVLRLQADCRRIVAIGCRVDYRLVVPSQVPLRIRTESGSVAVENMAGMVDVETSSGGVRLLGTRGPVRVSTSAGNVDGVDLVADFLDATTQAGRIRLSLAEPSGRVGLRTGAGNIDLALPPVDAGYRVTTETGAGKVDVSVGQDPGAARAVTATTGAGNIRIRPR